LGELLPNPTIALFEEAATVLPGFKEALTWFFMLLIQTLIGFFIAIIGIRIAKKQYLRRYEDETELSAKTYLLLQAKKRLKT
jgi:hypothetical protein